MYTLKDLDLWKDKDGKKVFKLDIPMKKWIFLTLEKGNIAGEHYHKGTVKIKNPEINIVLRGKARYKLIDVNTKEEKEVIVKAPKIIEIHPNVQHEFEALEDFYMIEPFSEEALEDRWEL